jgi:ABC-type antimicrobial peptide transport system permease subunit
LLLIEATLLGLLATAISIPISLLVIKGISTLAIPVVLPLASRALPLEIVVYSGSYIEAVFVSLFAIVIASLWPAKKGAYTAIVEALRAKS